MEKREIFHKIEKVLYATQPSPVVLVSTKSQSGVDNLCPIAMFMNCSSKQPQMIAIGVSNKTDTYANIKDTKEFVIGIPKQEMLEKLYRAGEKYDRNINEFEAVGLHAYSSKGLKCDRIEECAVNIDCVYENELEAGNHIIIVGKIVDCDMDEELYSTDSVQLRSNIPSIYHIKGNKFMVNGKVEEV